LKPNKNTTRAPLSSAINVTIRGCNAKLNREQLLQQQASARVYQARYDEAFSVWGARAKAPVLGENIDSYRRDLAIQGKRLLPDNHELRAVQYRALDDNALAALVPQLLRAVAAAGHRNDSVPDGTLREIVEQTPHRQGHSFSGHPQLRTSVQIHSQTRGLVQHDFRTAND
jgi:hypothetical protein